MEIVKFRILNYKSIIDSGDCCFSKGFTILAGMNESGKTSILEALEDFHEDREIRKVAYPIDNNSDGDTSKEPKILMSFKLSQEELNGLFEEMGVEKFFKQGCEFLLEKRYGSKAYYLDNTSRSALGLDGIYIEVKGQAMAFLARIHEKIKGVQGLPAMPEFESNIQVYKTKVLNYKNQLQPLTQINKEIKDECNKQLEELVDVLDAYLEKEGDVRKFIDIFVKKYLPYFILFSSFEDEFPSQVNFNELENNQWTLDLQEVSSFDIKTIKSGNDQERKRHQEKTNAEFSETFKTFWTQDDIKLQVEKDGDVLKFWVYEKNMAFLPNQRSKGQQWYLSFFVKVVARMNESKPNIILIDEPGLYLHAKAQKDLLGLLRSQLKEYANEDTVYPLVFSTHSPYLIEDSDLENVRLIEKSEDGTKILGKLHKHDTAKMETLTPVLTAIGLGLNDSITNLEQMDNVVVEGPSDVFYLQALKLLMPENINFNFINGGSSGTMGYVGAILEGWGSRVLYLFDNDQGKSDGVQKLKNWEVKEDLIKQVLEDRGKAIEDIFSISDFKKYVLEKPDLKYKSTNSAHATKSDKVCLARKFLQTAKSKPDSIQLDQETKQNVKSLFEQLKFD